MSMPRVSESQKRQPCWGKVSPETRAYLDKMSEPNDGRRIDSLVRRVKQISKDGKNIRQKKDDDDNKNRRSIY